MVASVVASAGVGHERGLTTLALTREQLVLEEGGDQKPVLVVSRKAC